MKKFLHLSLVGLAAIILFAACSSKKTDTPVTATGILTYADTSGLAEFQKWKTLNELKDPVVFYQQGAETTNSLPVRAAHHSVTRSATSTSMTSVGQYPAKSSAKKGWSRKATGAVIGGGGGAIIGALISKNNRLVGGALGGALGAGIGYVVGNELDRKHGR